MNYRSVFIEFLYEFKEYSFDNFQLLLFEKLNNNDLVNFVSPKEEIELYQAKMSQVFNKKVSFTSLKNSVVELLFMSGEVTTYEISSIGSKYSDLYNSKLLTHSTSKYLTIYPIFKDQNIIGGAFVYSNYQLKWNMSDSKLLKLINDLQASQSDLIETQINETASSKYWILEKDYLYLSDELCSTMNCSKVIKKEELLMSDFIEDFSMDFYGCKLIVLKKQITSPLFSMISIKNNDYEKFSLIYLRADENEKLEDLYFKTIDVLKNQSLIKSNYKIYQSDTDSITVIFEDVLTKNNLEKIFKDFNYIVVRYGNELKSKPDFKELIEYLNICPIEEFNSNYFKFYLENYYRELKESVLNKINTSKISVVPVIKSKGMTKDGVLIKDLGDIRKFSKEMKLKSLNAIFKILPEYSNMNVYLELPMDYFFEDGKLSLSHLNLLKRQLSNNCMVLTNFNENIKKILSQWPEFIKKIIIFDDSDHLYKVINAASNTSGIYFNSDKYNEFFEYNRDNAMQFIEYILKNCNLILVKVKQTDIIRYYDERILLICE